MDGLPATVDGLLEQPWYQRALEARGQVIFTNAYFSGLCGQLVVTVAAELPVSYFQTYHVRQDLPARGGYYVCDINGGLLYHNVPFTASDEDPRAYVEDLFDRINQGEPVGKNNSIIGMQGLQRGLYYQHMENGWLCIFTVPYDTLLQGVQDILKWYPWV